MAQCLRSHTTPAENLSLVPSIHIKSSKPSMNLVLGRLDRYSWPLKAPALMSIYPHIHIMKNKIKQRWRWERAWVTQYGFPGFSLLKHAQASWRTSYDYFFLFSNVKLFVPKQFRPYLSFEITSEHFSMLKMLKVCTIYFIPRSIGIRFQKHNMKPLSEIPGWHKSLL